MAYENIIFQVEDGIATITFNRPKALNALNNDLLNEFSHALDEISADEDIRVLILTGSGEKSFVAGADITELATFNALETKSFSKKRADHNRQTPGVAHTGDCRGERLCTGRGK